MTTEYIKNRIVFNMTLLLMVLEDKINPCHENRKATFIWLVT